MHFSKVVSNLRGLELCPLHKWLPPHCTHSFFPCTLNDPCRDTLATKKSATTEKAHQVHSLGQCTSSETIARDCTRSHWAQMKPLREPLHSHAALLSAHCTCCETPTLHHKVHAHIRTGRGGLKAEQSVPEARGAVQFPPSAETVPR